MRRCARAFALAAVLVLLVGGGSAVAQSRTALLQVGPEARRGIDVLSPDATPYWYGAYRVQAADVELIFVRTPLAPAASWPATSCTFVPMRSADGSYFYYEARSGWSLLVRLAHGELPAGVTLCTFTNAFVNAYLLFTSLPRVSVPGDAPMFPAVIEL